MAFLLFVLAEPLLLSLLPDLKSPLLLRVRPRLEPIAFLGVTADTSRLSVLLYALLLARLRADLGRFARAGFA